MNKSEDKISVIEKTLRIYQTFRDQLSQVSHKIQVGPNPGISAFEIYDLAVEILQDLIFQVSRPHIRKPIENPKVLVLKGVVDELGNSDKIIKIRQKPILADSVSSEISGLHEIIGDLISLKRNRNLTRKSKRRTPENIKSSGRQDRRRKRNKKRWFFK